MNKRLGPEELRARLKTEIEKKPFAGPDKVDWPVVADTERELFACLKSFFELLVENKRYQPSHPDAQQLPGDLTKVNEFVIRFLQLDLSLWTDVEKRRLSRLIAMAGSQELAPKTIFN